MGNDNLQPHIKLEEVDEICLISGNPDRVPVIASYLENAVLDRDFPWGMPQGVIFLCEKCNTLLKIKVN